MIHNNQSLLYVSYFWHFRHRLLRLYWYISYALIYAPPRMSPFFPPECPSYNFWGIFVVVFFNIRLDSGLVFLVNNYDLAPRVNLGGRPRGFTGDSTPTSSGFRCWRCFMNGACRVPRPPCLRWALAAVGIWKVEALLNSVQDLHSDQVQKFAGLLSHSRSKCSICWGIKN